MVDFFKIIDMVDGSLLEILPGKLKKRFNKLLNRFKLLTI
jgi:hypothetical protein